MPAQSATSVLGALPKNVDLQKAAAADIKPIYGQRLPGGITNGVAVLQQLSFETDEKGENPYLQAVAVIHEPATVATPDGVVTVRFDSLPSGGVFAEGKSAELCRTPCEHNIDMKDGGATDRRTFIVKSDGYRDGTIVVDFTRQERELRVTLEQLIPTNTAVTPDVRTDDRTAFDYLFAPVTAYLRRGMREPL